MAEKKNPNEMLTTKQVALEFNIKEGTLRGWRRLRLTDKRYPRYHKRYKRAVYYIRQEFEADIAAMEVPVEEIEI
ncbi:MAG: hypothetical protein WC374_06795 [Phycisphaerae bacterium]|jgi:transposase-like protein